MFKRHQHEQNGNRRKNGSKKKQKKKNELEDEEREKEKEYEHWIRINQFAMQSIDRLPAMYSCHIHTFYCSIFMSENAAVFFIQWIP